MVLVPAIQRPASLRHFERQAELWNFIPSTGIGQAS